MAGGVLNHVENISANGILCQTAKPLALMTRMQITLDLPKPENRQITADGVVVRCDPEQSDPPAYQVAILFTKISDEDHEAVRRFVEFDLAQPSGKA